MFNFDEFLNRKVIPRTEDIIVEPLAPFFDGNPVFKVRGLTGEELARCIQAAKSYSQLSGIVSGILSDSPKDKVNAIKSSVGLSDDIPEDFAKRIEMMLVATLTPENLTREVVVKLGQVLPVEFMIITNTILTLTGQGANLSGE